MANQPDCTLADPAPWLLKALTQKRAQGPASSPAAETLWEKQQAANLANYAGFPLHSCSVTGHPGAAAFKQFIRPHLAGRVLDIGCGPQPLPSYLEGYPADSIAGIDPLPPAAGPHPFEFVQARAEFLPWPNGHFRTVLAATSMDHLVDPKEVLWQTHRVLHPAGKLLIWATIWPDAVPYDSQAPPAGLTDDGCHAYHLGPWFRTLYERWFWCASAEHHGPDTFLELVPV